MSCPSSPSLAPSQDINPAEEVLRMIRRGLANPDPAGSPFSSPLTPASSTNGLQGSRTNTTLHARRIATRCRLTAPYNRHIEEFAVEDASTRELLTYGMLLSILQLVNGFVVATGPYKVDKPLEDNIKKFCTAVLMSPKLQSYKGAAPINSVTAIITRIGTNVPENFTTDAHIRKVVREHISEEMTQQRSRMKKQIKESIQSESSIYELASTMIDGTQCVVTIDMCARLALLRKVFEEPKMADSKFWTNVDERLQLIREQTNRDADQITAFFNIALEDDRKRFGEEGESQGQALSNPWQSNVDDVMAEGVTSALVATAGHGGADVE